MLQKERCKILIREYTINKLHLGSYPSTRNSSQPKNTIISPINNDSKHNQRASAENLRANYLVQFGSHTTPEEIKVKKTRAFATQYQPRASNGYTIHNEFFTPLTSLPTSNGIEDIISQLTNLGSFSVITNPETGLIQTSDTENALMTRQWFTDSCMAGFLQRETDPANWQRSMITNAAALNNADAKEAVKKTVQNPDWYRKGGVMDGVFHIYLPQTVKLDSDGIPIAEDIKLDSKWFNQKRLESQALMLLNLADTIRAGIVPEHKEAWGFKSKTLDSKAGDYVTTAISDLAKYLIAVNTDPKSNRFNFETPSASSWEEAPFKEGMTWDAAITILAMEHLHQLLFEDKLNPELNKVRKHLQKLAPDVTSEKLKSFIQAGRKFVSQRVTEPLQKGLDPMQTPDRPYDTSLSLLAASDYRFIPDNLLEDAKVRLQLVFKNKKALLGDHGMRRYNEFTSEGVRLHDSYLNKAFHFPDKLRREILKADSGSGKEFGSTDVSNLEALQERQALSSPEHAAQWGLGLSASLQALAKAKMDVLHFIQEQEKPSSGALQTLKAIDDELLDVTNRNIAAIPGPLKPGQEITRADGSTVKPYIALEAYEAVPDNNGDMRYIPGAHTLPWHGAQLRDGLSKLAKAQKLQESILV